MATFRLPNITGLTEKEQLSQINRYLFQLVGELQFVVNNLENEVNSLKSTVSSTSEGNKTQ